MKRSHAAGTTTAIVGLVAIAAAHGCAIDFPDYPVGDLNPGGSAPSGGAGGSGGQGGGAGGGSVSGGLGDTCNANKFCNEPLICLASENPELGPAHGHCTHECSESADCPESGYCIELAPMLGVCIERCSHGDGDAAKCHGRRDVACGSFEDPDEGPIEVCIPTCNDDGDCGSRVCNRRTGFCQDDHGAWALNAVGTTCMSTGLNFCRGYCSEEGVCAENCVIGARLSCNWSDLGVAPTCAFPFTPGGDTGDLGICSPDCRCDAECEGGRLCNIAIGDARYCGPPSYGAGIVPCPSR